MKRKFYLSILTIVMVTFFITGTFSSSLALTAREIVQKADERYDGESAVSDTIMILIDAKGNQRVRNIKGFDKDYGKDKKSIIFFLSPADVRNTAFLSFDWDDQNKEDDSWLYLPALQKVKRIASGKKSGSFMGSDFTYSDMNGIEINDWKYKFGKNESEIIDGHDTWVVIGKPKKDRKQRVIKETGYIKSQVWIRKDIFMVVRGKFWVKKGKKVKYLTIKDISKVNDIWTAHEMIMKTTQKGKTKHSSIIKLKNIEYNKGVDDSLFATQRMERGI